jgi:signal transduction histidine kinase
LGIGFLQSMGPGLPKMVPNTALALLLGGLSLLALGPGERPRLLRRLGQAGAAVVAAIGLATLAEYVFGWILGVDRVLLPSYVDFPGRYPGRPSPNTALCLALLGAALLTLPVATRRGRRPAEALVLLSMVLALVALTGYVFGVGSFYGLPPLLPFTGMALHTAAAVLTLGAGILATHPDRGAMATLTAHAPGGLLLRRLLPAAVLIPLVLGRLFLEGEQRGLYRIQPAFSLVSVGTTLLMASLLWVGAVRMNRLDQALRRAEAAERRWLQAVIDQMPEGVITLDAHGRVVTYNQAALRYTCGPTGEHDSFGNPVIFDLRRRSGEPLPWDEVPLARALMRGEAVLGAELLIRRASGVLVPVLGSAAPVRSDRGESEGAVVVFQDITLLKEIERLREQWTGVIAHDLRQPLQTIALSTEALSRRLRAAPLEGAGRALARIQSSVGQLNQMIADLLDASLLEARQLKLERRAVDLTAALAEIVDKASAATAGHAVRIEVRGDVRPAWVDPARLEQILFNLLSNAAKYGDSQGEILVAVQPAGDAAEVSVTNWGPGIPPELAPRLFQRFSRLPAGEAQGIRGIGLGLYITSGLAEAHGGSIAVESTPGATTTFRVTLPCAR